MLVEIFAAVFLGIISGVLTGLFPGIHINLVALMLFVSSSFFLNFVEPIVLVTFIVSMAMSHSFLDFIPSIFLGAPEESTALSVLPGHSLLLKGKGYEAIRLTTIGSYIGTILVIVLTPLFIFLIPPVYEYISVFMPWILIGASVFLILKEKKGLRIFALFVFILSGVLGFFSLNFYMVREPLFPLLTGLFGTSMLFMSIRNKSRIPKQSEDYESIDFKEISMAVKSGIISAPLCSFLPGLGASQAAVIGSSMSKMNERIFLLLIGMIGTMVTGLNFISLYLIGKGRSGTAVIIGKLIEMDPMILMLLLAVMLVSGSIAAIISMSFAKFFSKFLARINYQKLSFTVAIVLFILSIAISGWFSIVILITSTALGIFANEFGIKKTHLMGCLILPVILWLII